MRILIARYILTRVSSQFLIENNFRIGHRIIKFLEGFLSLYNPDQHILPQPCTSFQISEYAIILNADTPVL